MRTAQREHLRVDSIGADYSAKFAAPYAVVGVRSRNERLRALEYLPLGSATFAPIDAFAREVCRQLRAYFRDPTSRFDLPVEWEGTAFQHRVWDAVRAIPLGRTASYLDVAREIGSAPRPVGSACGANRLPLIVPCHRVVGSGGIGGFMHSRGGKPLDVKRWMLRHEGAID